MYFYILSGNMNVHLNIAILKWSRINAATLSLAVLNICDLVNLNTLILIFLILTLFKIRFCAEHSTVACNTGCCNVFRAKT